MNNYLYLNTPLPTKSNSCNIIESFFIWEKYNISFQLFSIENANVIKKRFRVNNNFLDVEIKIDSIDSTITLYEYSEFNTNQIPKILKIYSGNDILEIIEYVNNDIFFIIKDVLTFTINKNSDYERIYHDIKNEFNFTKWWGVYVGEITVLIDIINNQDIQYFIDPLINSMTRIHYRDSSTNIHSFLLDQNTYRMDIYY